MFPDLRPVCDLHICNQADVHFNATRKETSTIISAAGGGAAPPAAVSGSAPTSTLTGELDPDDGKPLYMRPGGKPQKKQAWHPTLGKWVMADVAEVVDMETEEVEPRLSEDEQRMSYVQRAADCCIRTALAAEQREIPFEEILTTVSELLDGDGWETLSDNARVEVEVCLTSLVRKQNMYPDWMLESSSFHLHHIGD